MEKLDVTKLNTPKDLPIGTILVQHWCNSSTFYKIVKTTEKSVSVIRVPTKRTHFEHEGGGTGYAYKLPDEELLTALEDAYKAFKEKYGFDPLSNKATRKDFQKASELAESRGERFWNDYTCIYNNSDCLKTKRIMVKPATNGGFYIPGVVRGSWCGNCNLWNGEEISDYYD